MNRRSLCVVCLLLVGLLTARCGILYSGVKRLQAGRGGWRPVFPCYSFARNPYRLRQGDPIDTDAVYLRVSTNDLKDYSADFLALLEKDHVEADSLYSFWRFYSNGRAFGGNAYHPLTNFDINNLNGGEAGYYRLAGTKIVIEYFVPVEMGGYVKVVGEIAGDTLTMYDRDTQYGHLPSFYHKLKEPWMAFVNKPDW
jgi:hypothetical protein